MSDARDQDIPTNAPPEADPRRQEPKGSESTGDLSREPEQDYTHEDPGFESLDEGAGPPDERRFARAEPTGADTDESAGGAMGTGGAMGSVRASRRNDPITGKPLYDDDSPETSSSVGGDRYRKPAEKGVEDDAKRPATGQPTSTPRTEPSLRDL